MTDATTGETPSAANSAAPAKKHAVDLQEVQDTVSRLAAHKGVLAVLILNQSGDIVTQSVGNNNSGDSNSATTNSVGNPKLLAKMLAAANTYVLSMQDEEATKSTDAAAAETTEEMLQAAKESTEENITFVRIRTPQHEILVAPKLGYTLVVLQDPSVSTL